MTSASHLIGDVIWGFRSVFAVMVVGLIIHWLPETFKQRYRTGFAALPLWAMALVMHRVVIRALPDDDGGDGALHLLPVLIGILPFTP